MALKLKVSSCIKTNCSQLVIFDTRGFYNATTNINGWGTPNATRASVTSATIGILLSGETVAVDVDVTSQVAASVESTIEFTPIESTTLGVDAIPNGLHSGTYTVVAGGTTYTKTFKFLSTCLAQCCIDNRFKLFADKMSCDCCTANEYVKETYIAQALIDGLHYAYQCGNESVITKNLNRINRICLNMADCGCS